MACPIPTGVFPSAVPRDDRPAAIAREFRALLDDGARLVADGRVKRDPARLLRQGYSPRYAIELFGTRFYLTDVFQNPLLRFFVAYVAPPGRRGPRRVHARIFYKDVSLIWRCGSHIVYTDDELWIGKGDLRTMRQGGHELLYTAESTTDLPLELQSGLETFMRRTRVIRCETEVLRDVLRNAPPTRLAAYRDFTAPLRRAAACRANLIHGGRRIARFRRKHDPTSLVFVPGHEPDFSRRGVVERSTSYSASYGGELQRVRMLSRNRRIQWLFLAGPAHVWIVPPQALTTELSSYGVRTVHVELDDDVCVPGYEYHFLEYEDDPSSLHSQIPPGFAGAPNPKDPDRADASAWLEQLPIIREFRRKVL